VDHFLVSRNLFDNLVSCVVNDNPTNPSDHQEVELVFNYDPVNVKTAGKVLAPVQRISWHKVEPDDVNEYKYVMDCMLDDVDMNNNSFMPCRNVHCSDKSHLSGINSLCKDLIDTCLEAGDVCFPKTSSKHKPIPKWNDDIKPLRDDSLFWHCLWKDAGKPSTGVLSMIMRRTRAKYHRAVKICKRNAIVNRNEKMAECVHNNLARDLWSELRKMDESRNTLPSTINGLSDDVDIANVFANKYKNLYKSVPTDPVVLDELRNDINLEICEAPGLDGVLVTLEDVQKAISKLNPRKFDGTRGTFSDHFIYSSERMKNCLVDLINCMIVHGYTPDDLLEAVITSIPKDLKGNLSSDDNYRGIALCSALCKIIDLIILDKYYDNLVTCDLQFAFKEEHSTSMCTTLLKEVCSYYVSKNSDVYICLLDASKAFDRVHYGKIFNLLKQRRIPALIRRLLLDMYTRQKMRTIWNNNLSDVFYVSNGVKQGGILSPLLFCVYFDELLIRIRDSGLGCHVGHLSYAGLGYADDVTTAAPSLGSLQSLLVICENFAKEFNVLWNCGKTVCIKIGKDSIPPTRPVTLNGCVLKWKSKVKHLGNFVSFDLNDHHDIMYKKGVFISQVNKLNVKFSTLASTLRGKLLQTYCCSWYGCQTWDIVGNDVSCMQTEWNKAVRRSLGLPYATHRNLLSSVVQSASFRVQHSRRVKKFIESFINSSNVHVSFIGSLAKMYCRGALGRNFIRLFNNENLDEMVDVNTMSRAKLIRDCLDVRDGISVMEGFGLEDMNFMIHFVCTE
jgi:hypothetical protein